ncbi:xanthine/uracil permease family protein [Azorhizobium caulinodans ORS 571]|uniref:Xanthine/uracil permease family protein n=1 Tax=Azorhizobium caulinodans (strain ATCC 43989 / DSM 5975 / JCM 20966 / LMG 6465 / NBRC 14845 / NCIMB 13405 / ORS 571) TaxID=438753 RepID=A8I507_AZOC5|nr:xanthine/uracil permease [Azorhizobium caulinodans]BAF87792.1 xanthine/uracil permease family protein [Azorhizobium caulinodans ORS 571]
MRKPQNLVYGVDDLPPARVGLLSALQQVAFLSALLSVPSIALANLGLDDDQFLRLAAATLFCSGFVLVLQGFGIGGVGARLFYPLQCTTAAIPALVYASSAGLSLAENFTMVGMVGVSQVLFSFVIFRLRAIFTVEVAGLAVFLIGVGLGQQGLFLVLDLPPDRPDAIAHLTIVGVTLATLVILHVYVQSRLRLFTNLIGLCVGMVLSVALGQLDPHDLRLFADARVVDFPRPPLFGWAFNLGAVIPFMVTGFVFALTSMGVQTIAQRNNDRDWKSPDLVSIGRGIRAEGVMHMMAGFLNAMPMVASGGAVALAAASGCTARALAFWTGGLLMTFSLLPKVIGFWLLMPVSVTGALFIFLSTFTTVNGIQLVASRVLDARKVLAIGMGFVAAIAYEPLHRLLDGQVPGLRLFTFSAFAVSILVTVVLLAIFRIGVTRKVVRRFPASGARHDDVANFIEAEGARWSARVDVVQRAAQVTWHALELIGRDYVDPERPVIEVTTRYNDILFDIVLRYEGTAPALASRPPTAEELLENPALAEQLTGFLITRLAPDLKIQRIGSSWELHFRLPV